MPLPTIAFAENTPSSLGLAHEIAIDPLTGQAVARVPVPAPPGRADFGPALALEYRSGSSNSPFGAGWMLGGVPAVSLDAGRALPRYDGTDLVHFGFGGEMVPARVQTPAGWALRTESRPGVGIRHWRARHESSRIRLEQWTETAGGRVHWRSRDGANTLTVFGRRADGTTRIADPDDASRVLAWLPEVQVDAHGNAILYEYVAEDARGIDRTAPSERRRHLDAPPQRYLKAIRYGNTVPATADTPDAPGNRWSFTLVFDYGDHRDASPGLAPDQPWTVRPDPYSAMRGGFDLRTWRLCRRILVFHDFDALGAQPVLVHELALTHALSPAGSTLSALTLVGHRTDTTTGTVESRAVPPLRFTYSQPALAEGFEHAPIEATTNAPAGLSGGSFRWVDLDGTGLPGLLYETESAWFYKANEGDGRFGPLQVVGETPSTRRTPLGDFNGDGRLDAAVLHGRMPGYFEREFDGGGWRGFTPIEALPHVEAASAHAQWMDLTGDGRQDLLVSDADRVTWYAAEDADRYGGGIAVARAAGGAPVVEDPSLGLFFADMNGDGLPDQVRVRNGAIEYWPQLGQGRFADEPVAMEGAPVFAPDGEFDPRRVRFVRLAAGGGSDLCYVGTDGVMFWSNAQGNRWLPGTRRSGTGVVDGLSSITVLDFLGDGRPCLVWSSPLSTATPMQYLPLAGAIPPGLLLEAENGLGKRSLVSYASSARHFLRDRGAGRAWRAGLASHTIVAERLEVRDEIAGRAGETRYEYHDGYYDSADRRFVGFGLVDRYEGEDTGVAPDVAPGGGSCERTWFHPGGAIDLRGRLTGAWDADPDEPVLTTIEIESPADWTQEEIDEARSSVAGRVIRTERFAIDAQSARAPHPLETVQVRHVVRRLQPAVGAWPAAVFTYQGETLSCAYEAEPADPRAVHELALDVDAFGLSTLEATVSYARRPGVAPVVASQAADQVTVERRRVGHVDEPDRLQVGIVSEIDTFEMGGLPPRTGPYGRLALAALVAGPMAAPVVHHAPFPTGPAARRLTWEQHFFWNDARTAPAALGDFGEPLLPHHSDSAAFATTFVADAFGTKADAALVQSLGYAQRDGHWWQSHPVQHFLGAADFFLPARIERRAGEITSTTYDTARLLPTDAVDPLDNAIHADNDYQALAPHTIVDANGTRSEVRYDALGVIVVSTVRGDVLDEAGIVQPLGHEPLSAWAAPPATTTEAVIAAPAGAVQNAGLFRTYDLDAWASAGQPPREVVVVRESFVHDGRGTAPAASRLKVQVTYFDGFGRERQVKVLAEPGPAFERDAGGALALDAGGRPVESDAAVRWMTSGGVVFDRALRPVRQFEPYYSVTPGFEPEAVLDRIGVSLRMRYDALGRTVREDLPNGSYTRTEHRAWEIRRFDADDTVADSLYRAARTGLPASDPERMALDEATAHADTPAIVHLDPAGREIRQVDVNPGGADRATTGILNAHGRTLELIDPRGLSAVRIRYDMLDRTARLESADAGARWTLADALDRACHVWDSRGLHQSIDYDGLDRVVRIRAEGQGFDRIAEVRVYGEDASVNQAVARNLRGRLALHRDQAGELAIEACDLAGQVSRSTRRVCRVYQSPPDWAAPAAVVLDADVFRSTIRLDALDRPIEQSFPDGATRHLTYAAGGGLRRLEMTSADGLVAGVALVDDVSFDARGDRLATRLGNGVSIAQAYDPQTHLTRSVSAARPAGGGGPAETLQDLRYTYDPAGRLVHLTDRAQEPGGPGVFLVGANVSPASTFKYDHLGRLAEASGRVHQALLEHDHRPGLTEPGAIKGTRHLTFNNGAALERYTRTYTYDASGNLQRVRHVGQTRNWTTDFWIAPASNRSIPAADPNGIAIPNPEQRFDEHGNCLHLENVRRLEWTERNTIASALLIERPGGIDDVEYYVYDANNLRVRKITERLVNGQLEVTEHLYLDGCEIKRVRVANALRLERLTSHISDGASRVALVNRWTVDTLARETDDVTRPRIRYQLSTHVGSASLELDETGARVSYEEYFPFGGSSFLAGDAMREVEARRYRYCGKERDDSTGLYYFEHRYYAAWAGRFMSADPAGPDASSNLYLYAEDDPVNNIDPQGLNGKRRAAPVVGVQHIPWDSLPAHYREKGNPNTVYYVLYGPTADGPSTYTNYKTMAEMQEAARKTPGAWVGVYDPRWQRRYEEAKSEGRKEEEARKRAEAMLDVDVMLEWLKDETSTATDTLTDPNASGAGQDPNEKGGGGGDDASKKKEGSGADGQDGTTGGAKDATGANADSTGQTGSKDSNATGSHDGDGASTANTAPGDAGVKGTGTGDSGTGPGAGLKGKGKGGGGEGTDAVAGTGTTGTGTGAGKGKGLKGDGTGATGGKGGTNAGDNPTPGGTGTGTGEDGVPDGVKGGSKDGSNDGTPGGTGTSPGTGTSGDNSSTGGGGQQSGGDPNGDPNGSPTGSPKGTTSGTASTSGGKGGDGQTASGAGERGGATNGTGTTPDAKGTGQNTGQPPSGDSGSGKSGQKATVMDKVTKIAGYTNLEFGSSDKGESGGIPGGMGTHNWGGWGQALYVALSVVGVVLMFFGGAGIKAGLRAGMAGIKAAALATARLFTKEGLKRIGTRIAALWTRHSLEVAVGKGAIRVFPVHAAWKAGGRWLHAAGSKPLYAAQQFVGVFRKTLASGAGVRAAWSKAWTGYGSKLTQLQRVATRGAEEFAEESFRFRLPSLFPSLAPKAEGRAVVSCVTSTWNAWSRTNLHIPNLLVGGGAGYGIWRLFGGGSGDAPQQQEGTTNAGAR